MEFTWDWQFPIFDNCFSCPAKTECTNMLLQFMIPFIPTSRNYLKYITFA